MTSIRSWQMTKPNQPMQRVAHAATELASDEVLVRVAGCGVCHTDLGFFYDGIQTVQKPPLTLGHEISGFVQDSGHAARVWQGKAVIIPAVMPCGECGLCEKGSGRICRRQKMPGNHIHGGFASHVVVPARYLCPVEVKSADEFYADSGVTLKELSVVADAVTTPYQAIRNAKLQSGDLAVFIGVGGVGGFGVQIAKALGATVVAIDIDSRKLEAATRFGADATFDAKEMSAKELRNDIRNYVTNNRLPAFEWKIFETSGSGAGQELAFSLLTFGATVCVVGFTMEKLELRLSNLMAYDAQAIGNWGCHPEHYPAALELVQTGKIKLAPFVQTFPMSEINSVFQRVHKRDIDKRPVLVPDFD